MMSGGNPKGRNDPAVSIENDRALGIGLAEAHTTSNCERTATSERGWPALRENRTSVLILDRSVWALLPVAEHGLHPLQPYGVRDRDLSAERGAHRPHVDAVLDRRRRRVPPEGLTRSAFAGSSRLTDQPANAVASRIQGAKVARREILPRRAVVISPSPRKRVLLA